MEADGAALVTGASRGIGRAMALELAQRGFSVVATMRRPDAGRDLLAEARSRRLDLRVEALDVRAADGFTAPVPLRVLVNNAGIEGENLPVETAPDTEWREQFETNVFGTVAVTRVALPALRAAGSAVICNITSASLLVPMPFFAPYRAGKAAVSAFGESLRVEVAPHGIRVVEILPGPIATDMLAASSAVPEAVAVPAYRTLAERVGEARAGMGEAGTPAAEAAAVAVDAILDDDSPLRCACDPVGAALLDAWDAGADERRQRDFLEAFRVEP